jgi:hypothetical protein
LLFGASRRKCARSGRRRFRFQGARGFEDFVAPALAGEQRLELRIAQGEGNAREQMEMDADVGERGVKSTCTGLPSKASKATGASKKHRQIMGVAISSTAGFRTWGRAIPSPTPVDCSCSRASKACSRKSRFT